MFLHRNCQLMGGINLKESPEENRNDHMYVYYLGAPEILPGKKGGL